MAYDATTLILTENNERIYHLDVAPGEVSPLVFAVGDPARVDTVAERLDALYFRREHREFVTVTGRVGSREVSVISTGMGTDNIDIFFTELDALFNVDFQAREPKKTHTPLTVIRLGTSGALRRELPPGSLLFSDFAVGLDALGIFYDFEESEKEKAISEAVQAQLNFPLRPYTTYGSRKLAAVFGANFTPGGTVTCPGFYAPQGREIRLKPHYADLFQRLEALETVQLTNFEMETAAYYALGKALGHEVLALNALIANRMTGEFASAPHSVVEQMISHALAAAESLG
jgi:uridine phosphorylase